MNIKLLKPLDIIGFLVFLFPVKGFANVIPPISVKITIFLGIACLGRKLYTFKRWKHENFFVIKFIRQLVIVVLVLALENFSVWAVSASDINKYKQQDILQDNVLLGFNLLFQKIPILEKIMMYRLGSMPHFLVVMLLLPFSPLWNQVQYSGFGMMSRWVYTIAISRLIRVPSFLLTVLPNPRRKCYSRKFPPVPSTFREFLWIGFSQVRGGGGCNDLIYSGHGIIWAAVCCMYSTYFPGIFSKALWIIYVHMSIRTVLERHHYAVDMWLAAVITIFVWRISENIYPPNSSSKVKEYQIGKQRPNAYVMILISKILAALSLFIIFGGS